MKLITWFLFEVTESFDDMNLKEELLRGIYAYGFEKPSAIQQRAIVPCVKGHDVIAQAQSGTGKTATFSISILQQIDTKLQQCQVPHYANESGVRSSKALLPITSIGHFTQTFFFIF